MELELKLIALIASIVSVIIPSRGTSSRLLRLIVGAILGLPRSPILILIASVGHPISTLYFLSVLRLLCTLCYSLDLDF